MFKSITKILYTPILCIGLYLVTTPNILAQSNTYAIVVGISQYEDVGIDRLNYAHRDAEVFYNYLTSKAGGNVPVSNIVMLLNNQATWTAMYDALEEIGNKCDEGDKVYFYFSGHGDVENRKVYKYGYLIAYNTPRINYTNRALKLEDLNNFANTLSIEKKVSVVLITDACHSGKLTGSESGGNRLVAEQLNVVVANEVRLTSCLPDELSLEDSKWGGGRSVFSYYLLNGLSGLADKDNGQVSVKEIDTYLMSSLKNDPILRTRKLVQTPVVKGKEEIVLAKVDTSTLEKLKRSNSMSDSMVLKPLPKQLSYYFFEAIQNDTATYFNYPLLNELENGKIPTAMVKMLRGRGVGDGIMLDSLTAEIENNPDALKRFQKKIVDYLCSKVQNVVNLYEVGDEAEIEKRRYYNVLHNSYQPYLDMLVLALKLTSPSANNFKNILILKHYMRSVALRLQLFNTDKFLSVLDSATLEIKAALELEQNAAYLHNELGLHYLYKSNWKEALASFTKASEISPTWYLPYSNMALLSISRNELPEAKSMLKRSDSLKPNNASTMVLFGQLNEKLNNGLAAEESYHRSIYNNSRYFLPFERLGHIYLQTVEYALADSMFHEAEERKKGLHLEYIPIQDHLIPFNAALPKIIKPSKCNLQEQLNSNDVMSTFLIALNYARKGQQKEAIQWYLRTIEMDGANPLAYHYLGKLFRKQENYQKASAYFLLAQKNYLNRAEFKDHCDLVSKFITRDSNCIQNDYRDLLYNKGDDYYYAGVCFEKWKHYSEAIMQYKKLINLIPSWSAGYVKLRWLQDSLKQYLEEEQTLQQFILALPFDNGVNELSAFYKMITLAHPQNYSWYYKAGLFHYQTTINEPLLPREEVVLTLETEGNRKSDFEDTGLWNAKIEPDLQDYVFTDMRDEVRPNGRVYNHKSRAIWYLEKTIKLSNDIAITRDSYEKTGDLYAALKFGLTAVSYYRKALALAPENSSLREKLVGALNQNYLLSEANQQLDTLWNKKQMSFSSLLWYANFKMKLLQHSKAKEVLDLHYSIYPIDNTEYSILLERGLYMAKDWKEATTVLQQNVTKNPKNYTAWYSLASIAIQQNNTIDALDNLKKSIDNGFNYYWILQYDPVWNKERKSTKWKEITARVKKPDL